MPRNDSPDVADRPAQPAAAIHLELNDLRPGLTDARVGLLPGLCPASMSKYHVTTQPAAAPDSRGPRHSLTGYTAMDKVQRRKLRARVYSNSARERNKALLQDIRQDVQALRPFHALVDDAPHIVLVLSDDLQCRVLYANATVTQVLHMSVASVLGRPLTQLVHPHDKPTLLRALTAIILSGAEHVQRLSLRVQTTYPDHYIRLDARFRYGTQGTHCTMWTE